MRRPDALGLLALAALWGASYLFIRMGAADFGAFAMAGARAGIAAGLMLPLLRLNGGLQALRDNWKSIALVGVTNAALPFVLFSYAALTLPAGMSAIFTATTPFFAAIIAAIWLGEALTWQRMAGMSLGFGGVVWLVADKLTALPAQDMAATLLAMLACLSACLLYGFSGNYSKRKLSEVPPLAVAAGSQLAAVAVLALPAVWLWPDAPPSPRAWLSLLALAVLCTAVAYVLFFRLIARLGAARTMAALFLIPAFGALWGALFLNEQFTGRMAASCGVILLGSALATFPAWRARRELPI